MRKTICALATFALLLGASACSDDSSPAKDTGPSADKSITDTSPKEDGPTVDPDSEVQPDAETVEFTRELTLSYDDGLPAVRLQSFPLAKSHSEFSTFGSDPLEVRKVRFIPLSAWSGTISVHGDQGGLPGTKLGEKAFSVAANDVDDWFEVDLSDQAIRPTGTFWITLTFDSGMSDAQETMVGGTYSSGNTLFWRTSTGYNTVNFEPLFRLVVGATDNAPVFEPPAANGEGCGRALDCQSGYCAGGVCVPECPDDNCDANLSCRAMELGKKICMPPCGQNSDCSDQAFCLTDTRILDPAGFCVHDGGASNGTNCQYQYHTFCESGHCTACDDNAECGVAGTCAP